MLACYRCPQRTAPTQQRRTPQLVLTLVAISFSQSTASAPSHDVNLSPRISRALIWEWTRRKSLGFCANYLFCRAKGDDASARPARREDDASAASEARQGLSGRPVIKIAL